MVLAMVQKKIDKTKQKTCFVASVFVFLMRFFPTFSRAFSKHSHRSYLAYSIWRVAARKIRSCHILFCEKNAPLKIKFLQRIHVVISRIPNFRRSNNLNATLLPAVFNISKWCPRKKGDASSSQHFVRSCSILEICCKSWTCSSLAKKALKQ